MKNSKLYITSTIALLAMVIIFFACEKEKDYPPLTLGSSTAPVVTLAHIEDSLNETYTYLSLSTNTDGSIYYVALVAGSDAPSAQEIILGNTVPASSGFTAVSDSAYIVKLKDLASAGIFDVYAVSTNAEEGKNGEVEGPLTITCPDETPPYIVEMDPSNGDDWVSPLISEIVLYMNEPVTLVDAGGISIVDGFDGVTDLGVMGEVTVNGMMVSIEITDTLAYLQEVAILIDAGVFEDAAGLTSQEYSTDGGSWALTFIVQDAIDMELFSGAYTCYETDYMYGGSYVYDVLFQRSGLYAVDIINMFDYGVVATLVFDGVGDSCYIPDQPSGLSAGGDPLNFTSEDLVPGYCTFVPGSYADDGSNVKVCCWLYSPALGDLYFASDLEFVKYGSSHAIPDLDGNEKRMNKGLHPIQLK
ncbi:MAG: Ig-like domain-containing protein [Bacteroidales bacterium]|nr:Ig-like domain-containing protein [Bacteroidales bacterium]